MRRSRGVPFLEGNFFLSIHTGKCGLGFFRRHYSNSVYGLALEIYPCRVEFDGLPCPVLGIITKRASNGLAVSSVQDESLVTSMEVKYRLFTIIELFQSKGF
jgi:hypothetical protein